jgi:hypothetical protein
MKAKTSYPVILTVLLAAIQLPVSSATMEPARNIEEMIESATSKADHDAIAARYEMEADELNARAERHERMGNLYRRSPAAGQKGPRFATHCEKLVTEYRAAAEQNREMARLHREVGAEMTE